MPATTADPVATARAHAIMYESRGWQALPSDPAKKKPLVRFADYWTTWFEPRAFDQRPSRNLQVMTGRHWGLAVLDLDGAGAVKVAESWKLPPTWTVYHSDGGRSSRHLWFSLPPGLPERRKRILWAEWDDAANGWKKHAAVELLIDGSLIMAPPSVHPKTGRAYRFAVGPHNMMRPAMLPERIWEMPAVESPAHARPVPPALPRHRPAERVSLRHLLDNLPDKAAVARECWGLRFAAKGQASAGWVSVHDPFREDRTPSARFHVETGGLWRPGERVLPFCQVPVALGLFTDWREAAADLAARYSIR
jgi:hypothetical protein